MRIRHVALPALLTATALAAPAAAQAATFTATVTKPCYGTNDRVALTGTGFTPNGPVAVKQGQIALGNATADAAGSLTGEVPVQPITANEETVPYTATDQTNAAIVAATAAIRFSRVFVVGRKAGANGLIQRIRARGFTTGGRNLYAHVRRGGRKIKDLRLGRLKGACRALTVKQRFFSAKAKPGNYPIYFDTHRRYRKVRQQQFRRTLTVFRIFRPAAAGALAATEEAG